MENVKNSVVFSPLSLLWYEPSWKRSHPILWTVLQSLRRLVIRTRDLHRLSCHRISLKWCTSLALQANILERRQPDLSYRDIKSAGIQKKKSKTNRINDQFSFTEMPRSQCWKQSAAMQTDWSLKKNVIKDATTTRSVWTDLRGVWNVCLSVILLQAVWHIIIFKPWLCN